MNAAIDCGSSRQAAVLHDEPLGCDAGNLGDRPALPDLPSVQLFGIHLHQVTMENALDWAALCIRSGVYDCKLVFTPNVDHIVKLSENKRFHSAYLQADLVLADGWPLVAASRWLDKPVPCRVPGSDFVPRLIASGTSDFSPRVFLLGGASGVGEEARAKLLARHKHLEIVGVDSPPFGFEKSADESARIVDKVNAAHPDLLVVGFGAPKQEIWLADHHHLLQTKVAVACGATIDFMAGHQTRAPRWMQRMRMEWLHRIATNPRRLAGRYLKDAFVFPRLVIQEYRQARE